MTDKLSLRPLSRRIEDWILPRKPATLLKEIIRRVQSINSTSDLASLRHNNRLLENKHRGKRCFVIGNGPSNRHIDLVKLKHEITIACNYFFTYSSKASWSPTYYCTGDPVNSWTKPCGQGISGLNDYWKAILHNTDCEAYLLHESNKDHLLNLPTHKADRLHYWSPRVLIEDPRESDLSIDFAAGIHTPIYLTPMLSLNLAIYMGCSPIYIIGCDNNYLVEYLAGKTKVEHFYAEDEASSESIAMPLSQILFDTYLSVAGFEKISNYAKIKNIDIFDLTPNGFLQCFIKCNYESIV